MIKRQPAVREQLVIYAWLAGAGAFAGLTRYAQSKMGYNFRAMCASAGVGVVLGIGVVGGYWGTTVVENPFGPLGAVLLIGYFQPNLSGYLTGLLDHMSASLKTGKRERIE